VHRTGNSLVLEGDEMKIKWITVVMLAGICSSFAWAKTSEKVLFSFNQTNGSTPDAGLVADKQGNLYGTTFDGGTHGDGSVFELSPTKDGGWTQAVLHNFDGSDGAGPVSGLIFDGAGNLYGTAEVGGKGHCTNTGLGCGVVFELSPGKNGWKYTMLYSFVPGKTKGVIPTGGLVLDKAGNLYGTTWAPGLVGGPLGARTRAPSADTYWGCDKPGCGGTVYRLAPTKNGWKETDLYAFRGDSDGAASVASLIFDGAGNLYGTTNYGGTTGCTSGYGCGVVFELTPGETVWKESVLHRFTGGSDGAYPMASVVLDTAGNLYSTASTGGNGNDCKVPYSTGCGVVFELGYAKGKWHEQVLYAFQGETDGASPFAAVVMDSHGNIYGTTFTAGDPSHPSGVVFKLVPSGGDWTEKVLHTFTYGNGDGQSPAAPLIFGPGGSLYGTTVGGGAYTIYGAVFAVTP
jgi:uncharacterized repeat protein (TIGR03803 family)